MRHPARSEVIQQRFHRARGVHRISRRRHDYKVGFHDRFCDMPNMLEVLAFALVLDTAPHAAAAKTRAVLRQIELRYFFCSRVRLETRQKHFFEPVRRRASPFRLSQLSSFRRPHNIPYKPPAIVRSSALIRYIRAERVGDSAASQKRLLHRRYKTVRHTLHSVLVPIGSARRHERKICRVCPLRVVVGLRRLHVRKYRYPRHRAVLEQKVQRHFDKAFQLFRRKHPLRPLAHLDEPRDDTVYYLFHALRDKLVLIPEVVIDKPEPHARPLAYLAHRDRAEPLAALLDKLRRGFDHRFFTIHFYRL